MKSVHSPNLMNPRRLSFSRFSTTWRKSCLLFSTLLEERRKKFFSLDFSCLADWLLTWMTESPPRDEVSTFEDFLDWHRLNKDIFRAELARNKSQGLYRWQGDFCILVSKENLKICCSDLLGKNVQWIRCHCTAQSPVLMWENEKVDKFIYTGGHLHLCLGVRLEPITVWRHRPEQVQADTLTVVLTDVIGVHGVVSDRACHLLC